MMRSLPTALFLSLLLATVLAQNDIFSQYYDECQKITNAMTTEQKLGQIVQADFQAVTNNGFTDTQPVIDKALGSMLISGISTPTDNGSLAGIPEVNNLDAHLKAFLSGTEANWKKFTNRFKDIGVNVTTS